MYKNDYLFKIKVQENFYLLAGSVYLLLIVQRTLFEV